MPVLTGVSFRLAPGEGLVLRGANGIGKTTLLRTVAGLQPPLSGTIEGAGERAGYASHADGIKPALTVAETLQFWADLYRAELPEDVFELFDLADLRDRSAGTLSAGQGRRLGLARLAVIGREVLLLDEPTVSLDAFSVKRFASFLRERHLARGGIAVIATHIDLGLDLPTLDLTPYRAAHDAAGGSDEAFL
ncbi:heme ABC exporter ATP-binding protein CcmA [Limimaricola cinnabarinus]|jgi:heme exporter protein A|uniref:Heme ABC exporter ATP-binding protein CcmA n=2 Tax=Limimaricola cinnabarinus TaxID=1125964 RepID=A0A2G1MKT3_9RHOB|nr:heme ABC exporter ATP-binding protein CcmA [Limimaricola cinnabarinus]